MIVVALLGLLIAILQDSYSRWSQRFRVESEVKTLHSYILDARARALSRYRAHFVQTAGAAYVILEDSNSWPDGNGTPDADDNVVYRGALPPTYTLNQTAPNPLVFSRDGIASGSGYIRIVSPVEGAQYDCIDILPTRIRVGLFNSGTSACVPR